MSLATLRVALILGAALVISMIVFRASATLLELGAALLLLGMPLLTQVRGTSLLQWVGRCSYEIYLVHMFVVLLLMHPFKARFSNSAPSHAAYWLAYGVMLAASVLLGFAVNRWFSEPINKALRLRFHGSALDQRRTAHDLDMSRKPMA
jgi:peptidoglycan/LPS O-acetylase OafA/YrhL